MIQGINKVGFVEEEKKKAVPNKVHTSMLLNVARRMHEALVAMKKSAGTPSVNKYQLEIKTQEGGF